MTKRNIGRNLLLSLILIAQPFIFFNLSHPVDLLASFLVFLAVVSLSHHLRLSLAVVLLLVIMVLKNVFLTPSSDYLNSVNTLRGEHYSLTVGRAFHNKIDLISYAFQSRLSFLSPSLYFGRGSYSDIDRYLPIPFIIPWFAIFCLLTFVRLKRPEIIRFTISTSIFVFAFMFLSPQIESVMITAFCFYLLSLAASFLRTEKDNYLKALFLIDIFYLILIWLVYKPL